MQEKAVLQGVRILDFTWVLAGPYATRLLADFGAEVIKVQPLFSTETESRFAQGYYNTWNRNKLGITLNMDKPQGIALARKLVAISDAVIENFTPRVMANWGLDYENLKSIKPDIIMLSMSAMGSSGPWRDYIGFGPTVQALSGITHLTSYPGKPPSGLGFSYADHIAGLTAALALLSALEYRHRTGEGQSIDLSQTEAMTSLLGEAFLQYGISAKSPEPAGAQCDRAAPYGVYRCKGDDRWCAIAVFSEAEWQGFKQAVGSPGWTEDGRFATLVDRLNNTGELDRLVEEWTIQHTAEEVMASLQEHGVAAGVVQNATDLVNDPQSKERSFFVELDHPELGRTTADTTPIKLSRTPASYKKAAPTAGQDNDYMYRKLLGLSRKEISELKSQGVI
jgi:crotonobetainyl-CoA:carnitine CoA-transferase CaiB-like acyl-CoA transferase